jgi:hypothetical protein
VNIDEDDYLAHYGTPRHSGRYPWGSGDEPFQNGGDFLTYVSDLRKQGLSDTEIAEGLKITSTQLRDARSVARAQKKQADIARAHHLKNVRGMSNVAIGKKMGIPESSVRALLKPSEKEKVDILQATANMLKEQVDKNGLIDIGSGIEQHLGISDTKLRAAVSLLRNQQGYESHSGIKIERLGTGRFTNMKVLAPPGTTWGEVMKRRYEIKQIDQLSVDGGKNWRLGLRPPENVNSKRIAVRYAEKGGAEADGVIYLRPGVKDLDIGKSRYAQVRIAVDGTHYIKGMAMYRDDLPDGVDIMFNTNKSDTGNKLDALKELKRNKETGEVDQDNPFGATIKLGGQRGALNIVNEEGDWGKWSKTLSSQMLSKQSPKLAKNQLDLARERMESEFNEIKALTNPGIRRKLLDSFADGTDAASVHLKAAAMRNQGSHVILPLSKMKETEIYAPNYQNGERVVLIRYPHGGIFEIPELTVNNRNPEGRRLIGTDAKDAVGINHKVAERLSGADFDGDTVLVIPNNDKKIKTAPALSGLKDFDPQKQYAGYEGMKKMDAQTKATQMGEVSNLITDMTIQRASMPEIERAVRHSMVVIDAEKHGLDWKRSALENNITQLKKKYQKNPDNPNSKGAATLISRANSRTDVAQRKAGFTIDKETGKKIYRYTGATNTIVNVNKRTGKVTEKVVLKTQQSKKLAETDDAHTLSSGTLIESIYADHSNSLKSLANQARKESVNTKNIPYSPSARKAYADEVAKLEADLNLALRNAPRERQAQILANAVVAEKKRTNPDMDHAELKRLKSQALREMRLRTGAKKDLVEISDRGWEAIQAGAITNNRLKQILDNTDIDKIKELATPKEKPVMSTSKKQRAEAMIAAGRTQAEVAKALGVSLSTLENALGGE